MARAIMWWAYASVSMSGPARTHAPRHTARTASASARLGKTAIGARAIGTAPSGTAVTGALATGAGERLGGRESAGIGGRRRVARSVHPPRLQGKPATGYRRRMPSEPRKDSLVGLLRRTANEVSGLEDRGSDSGALWGALERALVRARDAGSAAQRIASTAARQRSSMDAVADRTRALASRSQELEALTARSLDAFERLGLVALNAGLEAARRGEAEGRSLSLVGEEVRALSVRGIDAAREL